MDCIVFHTSAFVAKMNESYPIVLSFSYCCNLVLTPHFGGLQLSVSAIVHMCVIKT